MGEDRGSIAFFTTYRPPVALDIYSCPISPKLHQRDELHLTDGVSYNSNAQVIPPEALKAILKRIDEHPTLTSKGQEDDVDSSGVSGMVFVSERTNDLETLHIALRYHDNDTPKVEIFNFAQLFGTFNGVRMEDSGCIAGENQDYLVYISTKEDSPHRRQPWTIVYKTSLKTGETERLTPSLQADLSPSVSPSGKQIAVASFQKRGGWYGEREKLKTDIYVMNVEKPFKRMLVIKDGGWPTWGSEKILFFHRKVGANWGVFRADISNGFPSNTSRVTPEEIDAVTPVALDTNRVAVATIRKKSGLQKFTHIREKEQYRQIEVFDLNGQQETKCIQITAQIRPHADHFNPFIIKDHHGEMHIGYNRCKSHILKSGEDVPRQFDGLQSLHQATGLFRVSGVFPTFSPDGNKVAFVDNDFKAVWLADEKGLRRVYEMDDNKVFSPVWNQDPKKDILYVCFGPSFSADQTVNICAIFNPSSGTQRRRRLTRNFNNAFPSTNSETEGTVTKLVFRSTRDHQNSGGKYKNLYIMENGDEGDFGEGKVTRLTEGNWIDTHCKWSPTNDWIVFSSNRDMPEDARRGDEDLDSGYFSVYLVKADDKNVVVRVMSSGSDLAGHVNHPFFSPDGMSIVVTSDIAAVSADPMSLPLFLHSARPYGDIFTVDIDPNDIKKNKDLKEFNRITHSRYENATGTWTKFSTKDPSNALNDLITKPVPMFSTAPWLDNKEKAVVVSKISTAVVALFLMFPLAPFLLLGLLLFSSARRAR